jgi:hypothetical protein
MASLPRATRNGPFPFRQTFELGEFITTAEKGIIMRKIQSFKVCEFCILLYYARRSENQVSNVIILPCVYAYIYIIQNVYDIL